MAMSLGENCIVVEERANPSADFFVLPYLQSQGVTPKRYSFSELPPENELQSTSVLFIRYVPAKWKQWVTRHRSRLTSVCMFMDDDLFDLRSFRRLPLRYQWKLLRYSWSRQRWLRSIKAELLVSTPYLLQKYSDWQPKMIEPQRVVERRDDTLQTVFYHGSASHPDDVRWLFPVIKEVLARNERLVFEIIGGRRVNRLFNKLPRVHVLHPMRWRSYQALIQRPGRTIGLAPLLDTGFNRGRSPTKFYDITQAGAVGIYAESAVYGSIVKHGENGLVLPMEQEAWVEAILQLVEDDSLRERLLAGARACL